MDRECVQCSASSWGDTDVDFYHIDDYGSGLVCEPCAQEWVQCSCCHRLQHESAVYLQKSWLGDGKILKERWVCDECYEHCGARCEVLKGLDDREYIRKERAERLEQEYERQRQLSEVRETLQLTLERQAQRNRTTV